MSQLTPERAKVKSQNELKMVLKYCLKEILHIDVQIDGVPSFLNWLLDELVDKITDLFKSKILVEVAELAENKLNKTLIDALPLTFPK